MADHGKDALEKFNESIHYDLILMDIQMPIMSGLDAVDIIRESKKGKTIPIVAITALALKEDRDRILEHDFDFYITKPIELDKLTEIVEVLINGDWTDIHYNNEKEVVRTDSACTDKDRIIVLDEHVIMMEKLFLEKNYEAFEEEAQVLVDYFDEMQEEDCKLMAFKLIMCIRKEDWTKCSELIEIIMYEIKKVIMEEVYNENISS